jgi:hypothetical protein
MAALRGDISFSYLKQFFLVDIGIVTVSVVFLVFRFIIITSFTFLFWQLQDQ